jgi:hypothetical protein
VFIGECINLAQSVSLTENVNPNTIIKENAITDAGSLVIYNARHNAKIAAVPLCL